MSRAFTQMAASLAACVALLGGAASQAAVVNVQYDLTASALHTDYDPVNGLDWYTSLPLSLGGVTLTPGDTTLTVNVDFGTATDPDQVLLLDQMGLGAATNAPTTFGSPSFIGSGINGGHVFGPSFTLAGSSSLVGGTATLTPTVVSGALNGTFVGGTSGVCVSGTCDYGVVFPDLIDGFTTIGLSGFSITFNLGLAGPSALVNALSFNVIAPSITVVSAAPIPEPATVALMLAGLAVLAMAVRRRRTRA